MDRAGSGISRFNYLGFIIKKMENYEVVLLADSQGPVLTAKKITLSFQGGVGIGTSSTGNLVEANLSVTAEQSSVLRGDSIVISTMKQMDIRGAELEKSLLTMADGDDKTYLMQKLAIWKTFNSSLQTALAKAMKAQYVLDNPVGTV